MSSDLFTEREQLDKAPAAGYLRVSTETQMDGFGPDIQRAAVVELAAAEGLDLAAVFIDEGVSGSEGLDTRIELAKALDFLAEHPGATLIIPRLDRLARDLMVQESVLADAWKMGATVLSCSETERTYCRPDSPDDPARTLIRQVLGAVAAYERAMIRLRMTRGRRRLLDQQGWAGGPTPYGWDDPAERAVLAHVTHERGCGMSWGVIAGQLNRSARWKRNGRKWSAQELQRTHARAVGRGAGISAEALPIGQPTML
jgi:DNA invertase Pin-like site-specific DNA recombinase